VTGTLIRNGLIVDPIDGEYTADVLVEGRRIAAIGSRLLAEGADNIVDAAGRLVAPGFIDAHSHTESRIFDDDVQLALLRQGVTTVIVGQDGVSFAPGDGRYAEEYFGVLNGPLPAGYDGQTVDSLLSAYDGRTRLGVGYLVPAGTVRQQVVGTADRRATSEELRTMLGLIEEGLRDGALGLSSGLEYVPGSSADVDELATLCRPVVDADAIFVTHMRGYEEQSASGFAEIRQICETTGVAAHISHFHARSELMENLLTDGARGIDVTFDAYPYSRGSSLLSMVLLPPSLLQLGNGRVVERLRDESLKSGLHHDEWLQDRLRILGPDWAAGIRFASIQAPDWQWAEGRTLAEVSASAGQSPLDFAFDLLAEVSLGVTVVMDVRQAPDDAELARRFVLPGAMCGSDGIYAGSRPHPRGWGAFTRMLATFVVERDDFSWQQMVKVLSYNAAHRFRIPDRGRVAVGAIADLALIDPAAVTARSSYDNPRELSEGIDDVYVGGSCVLSGGKLTDALAGGAIRRSRRG
jgi:N-acyl-D-amino-acid deacylase